MQGGREGGREGERNRSVCAREKSRCAPHTHTHAHARARTHTHTHTSASRISGHLKSVPPYSRVPHPLFFPKKKQNKENHSRSQQNIPQPTRSKKMERKPVIFVQGANDKIKFILFLKSHSVRTTKKIEGEGKTR